MKTTIADKALPCPLDRVNRQFRADRPDQLWLSDFTYVSTWSRFVYVAFIIDAFARRIVGWRVSRTADAETDARRRVYQAPEVLNWREQRPITRAQTKSLLGR